MNKFNYKNIYTRSLNVMGYKGRENSKEPGIVFHENDTIMQIPYQLNSYGYRSKEFSNQKILTLGCSQTFGDGLPLENTWPYLLSKKMNQDYANLAKGGDGIQAQIIKAFNFFKNFHNPDYIFAIFPLFRLEMPEENGFFQTIDQKNPSGIMQVNIANGEIEKFSKIPHDPVEVIPKNVFIFYNLMFIEILDQYCKSNNINFFWTLWRDSSKLSNQEYDSIFDNISSNNFFIDKNLFFNTQPPCHLEYKDNILFDMAADKIESDPGHFKGHWGIHTNLHIVDLMYDKVCKLNKIE